MPGQPKNKTKLKILQFELPCRPTRKKRRGRLKNPGSRCHLTESGRVNCQPGQFDEITDQSGAPYFDGSGSVPLRRTFHGGKELKSRAGQPVSFSFLFSLSLFLFPNRFPWRRHGSRGKQPANFLLPSFLPPPRKSQ